MATRARLLGAYAAMKQWALDYKLVPIAVGGWGMLWLAWEVTEAVFPDTKLARILEAIPWWLPPLLALVTLVIAWLEGGLAMQRRQWETELVAAHSEGVTLRREIVVGCDETRVARWREKVDTWLTNAAERVGNLHGDTKAAAFKAKPRPMAADLGIGKGPETTILVLKLDAWLERLRIIMATDAEKEDA